MVAYLTIVTYHYVRPLAGTPHHRLNGLELSQFVGQLDHLLRFHTPVSVEAIIAAYRGLRALPADAILFTFDDGYIDHHRYVLPALLERRVQGAFFVPAAVAIDREILDVNKIHFILALGPPANRLVEALDEMIAAERSAYTLKSDAEYRQEFWKPSRYDPPEIAYFKRMLQAGLPEALRAKIVGELFRRFVTVDERAFADLLYCDPADLRDLHAAGMHIGSHGDRHHRLRYLSPEAQRADIARSLRLFDALGIEGPDFTFSYPYGDYGPEAVDIVRDLGFGAAFATGYELTSLTHHSIYELRRLDATDFPYVAEAAPSVWTRRALGEFTIQD